MIWMRSRTRSGRRTWPALPEYLMHRLIEPSRDPLHVQVRPGDQVEPILNVLFDNGVRPSPNIGRWVYNQYFPPSWPTMTQLSGSQSKSTPRGSPSPPW